MRLEQFEDDAERGAPRRQTKPDAPAAGAAPADEILRLAAERAGLRSAEAEAAAAAHRAAEARAESLCAALGETLGGLRARIERLTQDWAAAVGEAAQACLPCLAQGGFAAEVADAALRIARLTGLPRIRISLAPAHHDTVAACMAGQPGCDLLLLEPDPQLPEGRVLLEWEDGGAVIDRDRLERAAREVLDRHLGLLNGKESIDEHR